MIKLQIGQQDQSGPVFFMPNLGGLIPSQQELLLPVTEEMLQIIALTIGVINIRQRKLLATLTNNDQPKGTFENRVSFGIADGNARQGKGLTFTHT
jgi:hypothetical protein